MLIINMTYFEYQHMQCVKKFRNDPEKNVNTFRINLEAVNFQEQS